MRTFRRLSGSSLLNEFQSHHLIPVGVFANPAFSKAFEAVCENGFDVRCFAQRAVSVRDRIACDAIWLATK